MQAHLGKQQGQQGNQGQEAHRGPALPAACAARHQHLPTGHGCLSAGVGQLRCGPDRCFFWDVLADGPAADQPAVAPLYWSHSYSPGQNALRASRFKVAVCSAHLSPGRRGPLAADAECVSRPLRAADPFSEALTGRRRWSAPQPSRCWRCWRWQAAGWHQLLPSAAQVWRAVKDLGPCRVHLGACHAHRLLSWV